MKLLSHLFALAILLSGISLTGCGSGEPQVVEAPPEATEEEPAIEGMTDEEYDAAMDAELEGGN